MTHYRLRRKALRVIGELPRVEDWQPRAEGMMQPAVEKAPPAGGSEPRVGMTASQVVGKAPAIVIQVTIRGTGSDVNFQAFLTYHHSNFPP